MENIFEKYSDAITRYEDINFLPISKLNFNNINKRTTFKIDEGDGFLHMRGAKYHILGKYLQDDGIDYDEGACVALVDNFIAHLFSLIEVKKNGTRLDEIEYPGQASTIKGCISFASNLNGPKVNSGFESKYIKVKNSGHFNALGHLSDLGLGFFNDVKSPIYKGGFEITFTRNNNNDALYRWIGKKADGTSELLPMKGKIKIEEFSIKIPILEYDDITKVQLINELKTLSQNNQYRFVFKSWQCIQQKNISGKTLNVDITNNYRNIRKPLFGIVGFQTNVLDNQDKKTNHFDDCNVKNIWFEINGKRYPEELQNLDWDNNDFTIAYDMYMDYRRIFYKTESENLSVYLDIKAFKDRPLYVINLTRQLQNISETRNNIILHVDFNKSIEAPSGDNEGTIAYICMVSASDFSYDIINNTIKDNF